MKISYEVATYVDNNAYLKLAHNVPFGRATELQRAMLPTENIMFALEQFVKLGKLSSTTEPVLVPRSFYERGTFANTERFQIHHTKIAATLPSLKIESWRYFFNIPREPVENEKESFTRVDMGFNLHLSETDTSNIFKISHMRKQPTWLTIKLPNDEQADSIDLEVNKDDQSPFSENMRKILQNRTNSQQMIQSALTSIINRLCVLEAIVKKELIEK